MGGLIRKYHAKDQLYNIIYEDGDAEDLTLEEVLPLVTSGEFHGLLCITGG